MTFYLSSFLRLLMGIVLPVINFSQTAVITPVPSEVPYAFYFS